LAARAPLYECEAGETALNTRENAAVPRLANRYFLARTPRGQKTSRTAAET